MIHNLHIKLAGEEATSTCVMMTAIWPHGSQFVGEYRDSYPRCGALLGAALHPVRRGRRPLRGRANFDDVAAAGTSPD